jgi:hypothetical protein
MSVISQIPRSTSSIPLVVVKKSVANADDVMLKVNRERVVLLSKYLCANNPFWISAGITFNEDAANMLPDNGIPAGLSFVNLEEHFSFLISV